MNNINRKISVTTLSENCGLVSSGQPPGNFDLDSPASSFMVDFTRVHAITASASLSVNDALELMRANRIRALIVTSANGEFAGIISAMDLMGRKPMAYANEAGIPRSEVQVKNIMLAKTKLKAIARTDVEHATIGDVLNVLKSLNDQHILVVDGINEDMQISGMFSAADFRRALNIEIDTAAIAHTFSDLERVIHENREVM